MPLSLILIGTLLVVAGYNGTQDALFNIVTKTYENAKGLGYWILMCIILGVVSSFGDFKEVANAFILLACMALALTVGQ